MRPAWEKPPYHVTSLPIGGVAILTNIGTTPVVIGIAEADFTNVTKVKLTVRVNKIGSGTQTWQLWNETNSAALATIADAGASGEKTLATAEIDIAGLGLSGMKLLFLRASSSVAADDPVFRGGCVVLS